MDNNNNTHRYSTEIDELQRKALFVAEEKLCKDTIDVLLLDSASNQIIIKDYIDKNELNYDNVISLLLYISIRQSYRASYFKDIIKWLDDYYNNNSSNPMPAYLSQTPIGSMIITFDCNKKHFLKAFRTFVDEASVFDETTKSLYGVDKFHEIKECLDGVSSKLLPKDKAFDILRKIFGGYGKTNN